MHAPRLSELIAARNGCIDLFRLFNQFLDNWVDVLLFEVRHVDPLLNAEVVASHHSRLCVQALAHNEGEVRVLVLDVKVVVLNELSHALAGGGSLAKDKTQLSHTLWNLASPGHFLIVINLLIYYKEKQIYFPNN